MSQAELKDLKHSPYSLGLKEVRFFVQYNADFLQRKCLHPQNMGNCSSSSKLYMYLC